MRRVRTRSLVKYLAFRGYLQRAFMLAAALLTLILPSPAAGLPAFPGAQGFGSESPGGRGGKVIEVTNLNPSEAGSLRAALEASGPRIVVFRAGGTIFMNGMLKIKNPYITIAGQTAPGDGIQIRGGTLDVQTHDVVIRGLRIRPGDQEGYDPKDRDCIKIGSEHTPVYNVVIDHCSLSWSTGKLVTLWYENVHDITVQWCIISEALFHSRHPEGAHSRAFLIGDFAQRVTTHHCLYAHNDYRNPEFKGDTRGEVINNVIYNWGKAGTDFGEGDVTKLPVFANIIGNYYKPGTNGDAIKAIYIRDSRDREWGLNPQSRVYIQGNINGLRTGGDALLSDQPATPLSNVRIEDAQVAYEKVLRDAGATVPARDAVDTRIVKDVVNKTGKIIDSQSEVGAWPNLAGGNGPPDTDHDGMPDAWETSRGLDPNNANDGPADRDGDGYTNIEKYLNSSFIPSHR
jgi:pectate lyase